MTNSLSTLNYFLEYVNRVAQWNAICSSTDITEQQAYDNQLRCTIEEADETKNAIAEYSFEITPETKQEVMDGIADLIVTGGYLYHRFSDKNTAKELEVVLAEDIYIQNLKKKNQFFMIFCSNENEVKLDCLHHYVSEVHVNLQFVQDYGPSELNPYLDFVGQDVYTAYVIAKDIFGDELDTYIKAVLDSNDTKYLVFNLETESSEQINQKLETELILCREKYAGKHEDLVAMKSSYTPMSNEVFYVIRDKNGKGKILKPSRYKHPEEFLNG